MQSSFRQIIDKAVKERRLLVVPGAHDAFCSGDQFCHADSISFNTNLSRIFYLDLSMQRLSSLYSDSEKFKQRLYMQLWATSKKIILSRL